MERDAIRKVIIDGINEIQELSGRTISEIDDDTYPTTDVEGFSSLNMIELILLLEEKLETSIDDLLFDSEKKLSIKEMTNRIEQHLENAGA